MFQRYPNIATTVRVPIFKAGSNDFALAADWTYVAGDVKIKPNGGVWTNITNAPVADGVEWAFTLTAAEMAFTESLRVQIVDSATKAVQDDFFIIEAPPHLYAVDGSAMSATGQTATNVVLPVDHTLTSEIRGAQLIAFTAGTRKVVRQAIIEGITGDDVTVSDMGAALAGTEDIVIAPFGAVPLSAAKVAFLDAAISSRSSHDPADVAGAILSDGIPFEGARIDAAISSRATVADIWAYVLEGTITAAQAMRGIIGTLFAKTSGPAPGVAGTVTVRNASDTKDRIVVAVDEKGHRGTFTTLDLD